MYITANNVFTAAVSLLGLVLCLKGHKLFFPKLYCSINVFVYDNDYEKIAKSSLLRVILTVAVSLFLQFLFQEPYSITIGMMAGAFLVIWPPVSYYNLISIKLTKNKFWLLLAYISFLLSTGLIALVSVRFLYPIIFLQQNYLIVDILKNDGVSLMLSLICMVFPISLDRLVGRKIKIKVASDIDTFHEDVQVMANQMTLSGVTEHYKYEIRQSANKFGISENVLGCLVALEHINRGSWLTRLSEYTLCHFFPTYATKRDLTVGLCQIKISTAKRLLQQCPERFMRQLFDPVFNIDLCAQYIAELQKDFIERQGKKYWGEVGELYDYVASAYLGYMQSTACKNVWVYASLLRTYDTRKVVEKAFQLA